MKTNVYIDGFNLYHRALQYSPYKWLDLLKVSEALLPTHQINRIRFFTALVEWRATDPNQQRRQLTYIRALESLPGLTVHYGHFRTDSKRKPLTHPIQDASPIVEVDVTQEKGSDVNLATYLLLDGFQGDYEQACVISNDSDLALPIKVVRDELKLPIVVTNPSVSQRVPTAKQLQDASTFQRRLFKTTLKNSQFPPTLTDANGTITKPPSWV
ncbi:MAG: NYN domain-containing protein [Chloroflexi bacterium]|nr:NYN domain-containing protein [Chloroflexota bacterium]